MESKGKGKGKPSEKPSEKPSGHVNFNKSAEWAPFVRALLSEIERLPPDDPAGRNIAERQQALALAKHMMVIAMYTVPDGYPEKKQMEQLIRQFNELRTAVREKDKQIKAPAPKKTEDTEEE
jgi:hypothetical protein